MADHTRSSSSTARPSGNTSSIIRVTTNNSSRSNSSRYGFKRSVEITEVFSSKKSSNHFVFDQVASEFKATFVGRLVTTLIERTGDLLGENLDLLKAGTRASLRPNRYNG